MKQNIILSTIQTGFRLFGPLAPRRAARVAYQIFTTPQFRARHAVSDEWIESAKTFVVEHRSLKLKGYEWGSGEKIILLVHGWESRGTALRSFVPYLIDQGYRVVAFDGPAHGDSEGKHTNILDHAETIRAFVQHLGGIHGLIAHSFGGAATIYADIYLKFNLKIDKIVLIAVPINMVRIHSEASKTLGLPPSVAGPFKELIEEIAGKTLEQLDEMVKDITPYPDSRILLLHDLQDREVLVENSRKMAENWPNAKLVITDGFGHYRLMKDPGLLKQVGDFFHSAK